MASVALPRLDGRFIPVPRLEGRTGGAPRGMAPGSPTYALRDLGRAEREAYATPAAEAAALSRLAPASQSLPYAQAQSIRDRAIQGARAQTVMHYDIRRGMAQDLEQAAAARDQRIRELTRMILDNRTNLAGLALRERGLDIEERQGEQRMALDRRELRQRADLSREGMALDREELEQRGALSREGMAQRKAEHEAELTQRRTEHMDTTGLRREQLAQQAEYQQASLEARRGKPVRILPGMAMKLAKDAGVDVETNFRDEDGKRNEAAREYTDVLNQLRGEYPEASAPELARAAAEELGLIEGGGGTTSGTGPTKPPPIEGAVWSAKLGAYVVNRNGRWMVLEQD